MTDSPETKLCVVWPAIWRGSQHPGQGGLFCGARPALDMALGAPVERSGLGPVEVALSQLPRTLLTVRVSNALDILVASALDQLPTALDLIVCGRYVLRAGQDMSAPCHGAQHPGRARCSPCQSRRRWMSWPGTAPIETELRWLLVTALDVPVVKAAYIKSS